MHRGAVAEARRLKPEMPELGPNGLPKVDEIEFERLLRAARRTLARSRES
jgi:hypothetical protein